MNWEFVNMDNVTMCVIYISRVYTNTLHVKVDRCKYEYDEGVNKEYAYEGLGTCVRK